jgi:poly [ADP-ribose] polymerase 10/14/15
VVSAVLERSHSCFGPQVKVERKDSFHSNTIPRENISSVDIAVDPIIVKCVSKHPEQLKELVKDLHIELKFDDGNGRVICSSTIYTKADWKEKATTSVGSYIDSNYISTPDQWVPKDALQELYGHLANREGLEFEISKDGTNLKVGGEKKVIQSFEVTLKDLLDRYTVDTAEVKFVQDPETFHFLTQVKLPQMSSQLTRIQVSKDPHIPSLTLRGMKKDVFQFQSELQRFGLHSKVNTDLQPHIVSYLSTQDGQCQLQNHLSQAKVQAALYMTSQGMQTLLCESAHVDAVRSVATYLAQVLSAAQRKMPSSFEIEQENYLQLCQTCEKQHHVKISHAGNVIVVAGMKTGVDNCITELYKFILNSCTVEEHIAIERGELRLLLSHMKAKWDTIARNCETSEFIVTLSVPQLQPNDNETISKIRLRGERDCVKKISLQISKLQGSIRKRNEVIEQADVEFLTSERARTYLDGIEFREQVIIEVAIPVSSPTRARAHAIDTKHFLKCQAKLTETATFSLYIGDISEFNGADVIVNAANIELKHIGGVALALLKKGGPIIQEESTCYVRSHGNLKPGDAWLTTKVGNLPCKALVHVVGPKWSGNCRGDSRILEDACMQALQKSSREQSYQSIAFPTISAGVYGFPIDKCAVCMVKTILKFSQVPSNLKDIIVVIHTSKSADANLFISALKQHLPPDSIHVNDEAAYMTEKHSKTATGTSKSAKKKKTTKKRGSILPSAAVSKVPPGVLDCIKLVKGSLLNVTVSNSAVLHLTLYI